MNPENRQTFTQVMAAAEPDLGLACLLVAAELDPGLALAPSLAELDRLADLSHGHLERHGTADGLQIALGSPGQGFGGGPEDFGDVRASLLHEVLRRRRGLPILLSVVYLEVARRCGAALSGYSLPGHFVVGVPSADGSPADLLDPFHDGCRIEAGALSPWSARDTVLRVLANIRALSSVPERTRLWAVELSLLIPGHPVSLRRERGELLLRLGDYLASAADLEAYAKAIAATDASGADTALRTARMCRARLC